MIRIRESVGARGSPLPNVCDAKGKKHYGTMGSWMVAPLKMSVVTR